MNMIMKSLAVAVAATIAGGPSIAAQNAASLYGKETTIPFAANGGIRDWHADSESSIYLRDRANRWYHVTLTADCPRLTTFTTVAFDTDVTGSFDTFSHVRTPEAVCGVKSIVRSPMPAAKGGPKPVKR